MTRQPLLRARSLGTALVLLGGLTLSGCSSDDIAERAVEESIENAAENATGDGGEDVDVDLDSGSGEVSIDTEDGSFSSGGEIPEDFPSDEIPLLEGEILQAASSSQSGSEGYVISLVVDQGVDEAVQAAADLLTEAGFSSDADASGFGMTALTKEPYSVLISATDMGGEGTGLNYIVELAS